MGLFRGRRSTADDWQDSDEARALAAFARRHTGVEAFIEPRTAVTGTTLVLVAGTGEWTRRRAPGPHAAWAFGRRLGVPVYEATLVGYPRRMREWNEARSARAATQRRDQNQNRDQVRNQSRDPGLGRGAPAG